MTHLGHGLQYCCLQLRLLETISTLLARVPAVAKLAVSGEIVAVECVMPGTEVLVPPGESVPLDGTVVVGESAVDESLLTGGAVWGGVHRQQCAARTFHCLSTTVLFFHLAIALTCSALRPAGESVPVTRRPGSLVQAGTINVGAGTLLVCTTAAAGDTAVARMAALVEQAASQQSPAEALVAKV